MSIILNVVLNYFRLIPTLIATFIFMIPVFCKRKYFFEDETDNLVVEHITAVVCLGLHVIAIHLIITKMGMIYIE